MDAKHKTVSGGRTAAPGQGLAVVEVRMGALLPPPAEVPAAPLPTGSRWTAADLIGSWKVRWGIGRMRYRVAPGLYSLNGPDRHSPVVVSANYKLSFDVLRRSMAGRKAWVLVLDTDGINVWCAAGKGTFGTGEIVRQVRLAGLDRVVDHRRLIVPQLGAPGVSAREVRRLCGFRVTFGPVRAGDLPRFLDDGLKADASMRRVSFTVRDRVSLLPMEVVPALRWSLPVLALLVLLGGLGSWGFSAEAAARNGLGLVTAGLGALVAGTVVTPLLLPFLPGRAFSVKGLLPGLAWAAFVVFASRSSLPGFAGPSRWDAAAWLLALPAVSAFCAMCFTGSSAVTSLSGVRKEMRLALPLQIAGAAAGILLWLAGHFLGGAV